MIRTLFICSALVASSAAGAVALSALHDATGDRQVRTLAPAPVATVEPRFVIPTFAPSQRVPEVVQVAVLDMPDMPSAPALDTSPVIPEAATGTASSDLLEALDVPAEKSAADVHVPAKKARPAMKPAVKKAARAVRTETVRTFKQRTVRPVIVAQAPAFSAQQGALQPDYVIGVYR